MKKNSSWFVFVLVAIAQFMVVLDSAITNVALPAIQSDLHFTSSSLQWVVTSYILFFGGFLLLGGRSADLFGRRRILLYGMLAFTLFSFAIGISNSALQLIIFRAFQGLSAAFMSPAALSIVLTTFKDGKERNKALGYWTLVATGGAAVGMLLGGVLTEYLGWRWNFFINVPIGLVMSYMIYQFVPAHDHEEKQSGLDIEGAFLVTLGLVLLVFTISQAPEWGWLSLKIVMMFFGAIVILSTFIYNESIAKNPLLALEIFKIRNVTGANLVMIPVFAAMLSTFFLLTLYLQEILHYSPLVTSFAFMPFPIILAIMATNVPKHVSRFGFKPFIIIGPIGIILAFLWLARAPVDGRYIVDVLPALILMPLGIGLTVMPAMAAATSGVPAEKAGLASGLINTSQQMGGALGLSILSGVAASVSGGHGTLTPDSIVLGYHRAFLTAIVFLVFAILIAIFVIKKPDKHRTETLEVVSLH